MAEVRVAAENRKARRNYFIDETLEAGIVLVGTEVKSLRLGRGDIAESYATAEGGEIFLVNAHIPEYAAGNRFNHEPRRRRKLLLHKREIKKLYEQLARKGGPAGPHRLYFNERGIAKVLLGLARGKRQYDKRATVKERDWKRQQQRLMKSHGRD